MSDYTRFTCGNYGSKEVDLDAIRREYSNSGLSYYGDGSEFVCGYDGDGNAMVKTDDIMDAIRRKTEDAERERRCDEALYQFLLQQAIQKNTKTYIDLSEELICFPLHGGVKGFILFHRADVDCPYKMAPKRIGPFLSLMHGVKAIHEYSPDYFYPCPFCIKGDESTDVFINGMKTQDSERMQSIRVALMTNKWRKECYSGYKNGSVPGPDMTLEAGSMRVEEAFYTFQPDTVFVRLKVDSEKPILEEQFNIELRMAASYTKKGLFGGKSFTVLTGNENPERTAVVTPWEYYEGDNYGYIFVIAFVEEELVNECNAGNYDLSINVRSKYLSEEFNDSASGFLKPSDEFPDWT